MQMIKMSLCAIAAIALVPMQNAIAQEAPESESMVLEEVIVTAQRREIIGLLPPIQARV